MKKIDLKKNAAKVGAKAPVKSEPEKAVPPAATKGPDRPKFVPGFCLQEKSIWDGNERFYDANSSNCKKSCKNDCPQVREACIARDNFIAAMVKETKGKKTSTGERKTRSGIATQTSIINTMLAEKKPLVEIIAAVAKAHYSDNEAGRSVGTGRVNRHIKSIKDGSCKNADALKVTIAYLDKPVAKAVAAKK